MRTNLPVTEHELTLAESTLIVSQTDLKGRITYVNRDFLETSGYAMAELIGAPHNVLRHPDMPAEVFADLWHTLKEGRPWTGHIKNRCKNGDYYWVLANVTPLWEGEQISGYMSVRRRADPAAVASVETAYRLMREKQPGKLRMRYGAVVNGAAGFLDRLNLAGRIGLALGGLGLSVAAVMLYALLSLARVNDNVHALYELRYEPVRIVGRIGRLMAENRGQIMLALQHDPESSFARLHEHPLALHTDAVKQNIAEITALWGDYQKTIVGDQHRAMAEAYAAARQVFVQEGLLQASAAMERQEYVAASLIMLEKMNPAYEVAIGRADALFRFHTEQARSEERAAQARYESSLQLLGGALVLLLLFGAVAGLRLIASIRRPIAAAIDTFRNITQGNYSNAIDIARNDEMGKLNQALQSMQTRMGFEVAEARRQADEMTRIKIALDCVSTPVRIADVDGTVIYANAALKATLRRIEPALKAQNPAFSIDAFIGSSIGNLYADPQAAVQRLASLTATTDTIMDIGGRTFRVVTSPVFTAAGERLGSVGEWQDRTEQLLVEREIEDIIDGANAGDFTRRIELAGKEGFFRGVAQGLNQLLETASDGLAAVAQVLNALARGELTQTMQGDYRGTFGQLKDDTNTTVERLREVVGRIQEATAAIDVAAQEIAAGNQDLSSRTEQQASSLEETASAMEELNVTVRQNAASARQANELARGSNEIAARGGQMVQQVVRTMGDIQSSAQKIASIIGVIDNIAFQTNILALNAAVEAARAGEQGRGFAVVASEVRNLAQRSATAAKEIKALIADSVEQVESGARLANAAGSTMDEVVASFERVAYLVTDIANASREQAAGIEQVTQAVGQMDEATQQNAALVEEAAAAAESLEEQMRGLVQAVGIFKLAADGGQLPGPVLRDATPRQLAADPQVGAGGTARRSLRQIAPPHLAGDAEEWEEF